ncbi:MAG: sigma-54-dependent Fis family transcriptional regulator [Deltaproteobacteria bacterium]|nr:sigma-54-dependent Fis family transcriptional regulator [Deltaproteobacteria bacterium]
MKQGSILIADDEELIRRVLADTLSEEGYTVETVDSGAKAWACLQERPREQPFDVAFFDIRMPEPSGLDLLLRAQDAQLSTHIVIMTGQTTMANAVEAMKRGAFDYLTKPFDLEEVKALAARALEAQQLRTASIPPLAAPGQQGQIIGHGPAMQVLYKTIGRVVKSDATILIQGESGTGKELIARVLHHYSSRWRAPFVGVNCSAIPAELLESEFFGHERGAFTGAVERRVGKFEQAAKGTLFLDEIGDMPLALQAKLLRVLQEREFTRVGGRELIKTDIRVIAATNQDLALAVKEQRFREDLYFRLRVVPLTLPSLRQRREDIPELVSYFIEKVNREMDTAVAGISAEAMELLTHYSWPGNVRELENTILRAAVLAPGRMLTVADLSLPTTEPVLPENFVDLSFEEIVRRKLRAYFQHTPALDPCDLYAIVIDQVEKPLIELTLEYTSGNQLKAAELLGINRNTLRKKITDLRIEMKKGIGD